MKYNQKTGILTTDNLTIIGRGYSGKGIGKNNPEMESVKNVGPIPKGIYRIGKPFDDSHMGHFVLPLIPDPNNTMYGRSQFYCHGDNINDPGNGSEGCPIMPRKTREYINNSNDKTLYVV
jgi:hypothetical protein